MTFKPRTFTPEQTERAKVFRAAGMPWREIARMFGVKDETVRRAVDPEYSAHRAEQIRLARQRRKAEDAPHRVAGMKHWKQAGIFDAGAIVRPDPDAIRLRDQVPSRETRSLTGALMGDPIPGDPRRPWLQHHFQEQGR